MTYKNSAKNRKLKRSIIWFINFLKFESLNITTPEKILFFGIIFTIIWLFLNWVESVENIITSNSFGSVLWLTWYIVFFLQILILFLLFSWKHKEMIKFFLNIKIKDTHLIFCITLFTFLIILNWLFFIDWLEVFKNWILIWKWVIVSFVWNILSIVWWIFMLKTKDITWIYIENSSENSSNTENKEQEKDNMTLPF